MKNVLVTGVSRGMGEATARLLVHEGCFVYGVYNSNKTEAEKLVSELKNIKVFQCDFSKRENTKRFIEELKGVELAGIVNSAGIFLDIDFENFEMGNWEQVFEVNLHAPLLLVQGLQRQLEDGASVVNISSTDAFVGSLSGMAYSASKAAFNSITLSLANILGSRGIRVNAITPGWIGDGMRAPRELLEEAAKITPIKRNGTYEEIAQLVSFLLSDKSSYVNGTTITIDGGDMAVNVILQKEAEMLSS